MGVESWGGQWGGEGGQGWTEVGRGRALSVKERSSGQVSGAGKGRAGQGMEHSAPIGGVGGGAHEEEVVGTQPGWAELGDGTGSGCWVGAHAGGNVGRWEVLV